MEKAWRHDEFVRDPSRLTLLIGPSGIDGDTFKHSYLMDKYGIQVNKTSRNSVLFMTNIGTSRSSVAYLIEVLAKISEELDDELAQLGPLGRRARDRGWPPSPPTRRRFRTSPGSPTGSGTTPTARTATCGRRTSWPTSRARASTFQPRSWPLALSRAGKWSRRCSSRPTHPDSLSSSPARS